jgi:cellulose synthase/poly-beta-1,6-N-acetylglucosamine synthase-like glycosyltransferase
VLVPAHNERAGLQGTLNDIKDQLQLGDRLIVVADNCTDDTAEIGRATRAEVTERTDLTKIGKGYALEWGLQHLSTDPPDVVVIVDADCRLAPHTVDSLAKACAATGRPIQALNLMSAPDDSSIDYRVAVFAFRVKNWARALGLRALNIPCQLMGTGMAFPWMVIRSANLATGNAVEDLNLGLELARAGHPPLFFPSAGVNSQFPSSAKGAKTQRQRWEQGHLGTIIRTIPRLVWESLIHGNVRLLVLTLDAAVPPLTLLGALVILSLVLSFVAFLLGLSSAALIVSTTTFIAFALAVFLAWLKFGYDIVPPKSILSVFTYAIDKLPLYRRIFSRRSAQWVRTDRDKNGT